MTYNIMIENGCSLEELAGYFTSELKLPVQRCETPSGAVYRGRKGECSFDIFDDPGLVDDGGIAFSKFKLQIDLEWNPDVESISKSELHKECALDLASKISAKFRTHCIVVRDLQQLIASFER